MRSGTVLKSILSGAVALAATIFVVYYPTRTAIADVLLLLFKWEAIRKAAKRRRSYEDNV